MLYLPLGWNGLATRIRREGLVGDLIEIDLYESEESSPLSFKFWVSELVLSIVPIIDKVIEGIKLVTIEGSSSHIEFIDEANGSRVGWQKLA